MVRLGFWGFVCLPVRKATAMKLSIGQSTVICATLYSLLTSINKNAKYKCIHLGCIYFPKLNPTKRLIKSSTFQERDNYSESLSITNPARMRLRPGAVGTASSSSSSPAIFVSAVLVANISS